MILVVFGLLICILVVVLMCVFFVLIVKYFVNVEFLGFVVFLFLFFCFEFRLVVKVCDVV